MTIWLIEEGKFERLKPYFPKLRGKPRVDDRLVLSGIAYVLRNGLRWKDAPRKYGPSNGVGEGYLLRSCKSYQSAGRKSR